MKIKCFTLFLSLVVGFVYSQDTYKRTYYIPKSKLEQLKVEKKIAFSDLTRAQQDSVRNVFKDFNVIEYTITKIINGKKVEVKKVDSINEAFFKKQKYSMPVSPKRTSTIKAFVKFPDDNNLILINPFLNKNDTINSTYYIPLKNRRTEWLPFTEFTISSVTIPLKYRFGDDSRNISEEFTSGINLNFLIGYSYGNTSFTFRDKVGNKTNTWKLTGGIIFGASTLQLNNANTSASNEPIEAGNTISQGLFSFGFGATYSFNKLNFGLFYGWDYSLGDTSEKWNYDKEPWLGLGIGYSLFKF